VVVTEPSLEGAAVTDAIAMARVSPADRQELYARGRRRRYARREVVFHEGDIGESAVVVLSGCLAARKTGPDGEVGLIGVLGPGEVAGELALVQPAVRRTVTVFALDPAEVLIVERGMFAGLGEPTKGGADFLLTTLTCRIRRLEKELALALLGTSEDRIAVRLASLADVCLTAEAPDRGIAVTQQDLASLTGTSRATVNRVLGGLADGGAIAVRRGRIQVLDRELLLSLLRPGRQVLPG
jgi:CRP/FNR family transcriptional regulator, cyclic AMP receptor protein